MKINSITYKTRLEKIFYQRILRPLIFTSRIGRRAILGRSGSGLFIDYIYRNSPSGYSRIGHLIDRILLALPSAKATKEKKERISQILQMEIRRNSLSGKKTKIVDIGSGVARYIVELLRGEKKEKIQAICFDIDKNSLKYGRYISQNCPIEYRLGNITRLGLYRNLAQKLRWQPNVIIVSTCYEFLSDGVTRSSMEDIYKTLEVGGVLVIASQVDNPNRKLFEKLMTMKNGRTWDVRYRKPFVIKKWLIEAGFKNIDIDVDKWGMHCYYVARKIGTDDTARVCKFIFQKSFSYTRASEQRSQNIYHYMRGFRPLIDGRALRDKQKVVMLASNDYLGLSMRKEVIKAANMAAKKYGASTASSRILAGNLDIHEELQEKLANFLKTEDVLVFSTGYMANVGVISSLLGNDDIAFFDRNVHASLLDGAKLSNGKVRFFPHNNINQLEKLLQRNREMKGKAIVCDGVYSMEGDLAPLPQICDLAEKYNVGIIVDDGHATGILGENGRGTIEHFKVEDRVDLILGSLGKSLASVGGFVAGSHVIIDHLRHTSRSFLFSTALAPSSVAAAIEAIKIIQEEPWLRQRLWDNTFRMKQGLCDMGYNIGKSETALVSIIIGDESTTGKMVMALEESGIIVDGINYPAVKKTSSRIRMRIRATHKEDDIDFTLSIFKKIGKKFRII